MIEPTAEQRVLGDVFARLELRVVAPDRSYGVIDGNPVAVTVLGTVPLALLLAFKIRAIHPDTIELPPDITNLVNAKLAEASLENGIAWLSLDNLHGAPPEVVESLIVSFAKQLTEAGLRLPNGCAKCGSDEGVDLAYVGGRCNRLCAACRSRLDTEVQRSEQQLNGYAFPFALALPLMCLYVSGIWVIGWAALDIMRDERQTDVVTVNSYDIFIILAILAGVAGYPLGIFLRRSGVSRRVSVAASFVAAALSCAIGEWLYVNWALHHATGVIDPFFATKMFWTFVTGYDKTWVVSKMFAVLAIAGGCCLAMNVRREVEVSV